MSCNGEVKQGWGREIGAAIAKAFRLGSIQRMSVKITARGRVLAVTPYRNVLTMILVCGEMFYMLSGSAARSCKPAAAACAMRRPPHAPASARTNPAEHGLGMPALTAAGMMVRQSARKAAQRPPSPGPARRPRGQDLGQGRGPRLGTGPRPARVSPTVAAGARFRQPPPRQHITGSRPDPVICCHFVRIK